MAELTFATTAVVRGRSKHRDATWLPAGDARRFTARWRGVCAGLLV
ncbi:hypothetical protein [Glutamicibacter ardleyensis]